MKKKILFFVCTLGIAAMVLVNVNVAFNMKDSSLISLGKFQTALASGAEGYESSVDYFVDGGDGYDYCCSGTPTYGHYKIELWYNQCFGVGEVPCEDGEAHYTHTQHRFDCGCWCLQ